MMAPSSATLRPIPRIFAGKHVLLIGGTGSLGQALTRRLLSGDLGVPERIVILSRDEAKQHQMRVAYSHLRQPTDEVIYANFKRTLQFRIGDVRSYDSIALALDRIDVVVAAAALKQVPTCEYFPHEATLTNVIGTQNLVTAVARAAHPVEAIVGISTDKAVHPVNVMGMTKALQERLLIAAQLSLPDTRVLLVRYGNVLASRGSVIPLFREQIRSGGPVTITSPEMTRFLLSLSDAVDAIAILVRDGKGGEILVPKIASARIVDIARAMVGGRAVETVVTGIRPGEKVHEVLIAAEESPRTVDRGSHYVVRPLLPELAPPPAVPVREAWEYTSASGPMPSESVERLLRDHGLLDLEDTAAECLR